MALRKARRRTGGSAASLGGVLLAAALLAGCEGTIEAYRSVSGMNKNDPDPATAPFTANLDQAEARPYANLASVPPPPLIASSLAERQSLSANLTGARAGTQAGGGTAAPGPVPPPPPIPPSIAAPEMASAPLVPRPQTPLTPLRRMDEPPLPLPPESTMQAPTIANLPGVLPPRSAPPPGQPSPIPRPAPSDLPPAAAQSGNPLPPVPVAALPAAQPPPEVVSRPPPKLPPVAMTVASLDVAPGSAALAADTRPRLAEVVAQYQQRPRTVRVVSFAAPAVGGAEQLNAFRAALDRAQLVAKELAAAGIPAKQIQTEASPSGPGAPIGRIEIQLLP